MNVKEYLDNLWLYKKINNTIRLARWSWADRLFLYTENKPLIQPPFPNRDRDRSQSQVGVSGISIRN